MSEERIPDARISISLHKNIGKKTTKIHLFLSSKFRTAWSPELRKQFFPPVPMQKEMADEYWNKKQYRVMVGGRWMQVKGRYSFYTIEEIYCFVREAFV